MDAAREYLEAKRGHEEEEQCLELKRFCPCNEDSPNRKLDSSCDETSEDERLSPDVASAVRAQLLPMYASASGPTGSRRLTVRPGNMTPVNATTSHSVRSATPVRARFSSPSPPARTCRKLGHSTPVGPLTPLRNCLSTVVMAPQVKVTARAVSRSVTPVRVAGYPAAQTTRSSYATPTVHSALKVAAASKTQHQIQIRAAPQVKHMLRRQSGADAPGRVVHIRKASPSPQPVLASRRSSAVASSRASRVSVSTSTRILYRSPESIESTWQSAVVPAASLRSGRSPSPVFVSRPSSVRTPAASVQTPARPAPPATATGGYGQSQVFGEPLSKWPFQAASVSVPSTVPTGTHVAPSLAVPRTATAATTQLLASRGSAVARQVDEEHGESPAGNLTPRPMHFHGASVIAHAPQEMVVEPVAKAPTTLPASAVTERAASYGGA